MAEHGACLLVQRGACGAVVHGAVVHGAGWYAVSAVHNSGFWGFYDSSSAMRLSASSFSSLLSVSLVLVLIACLSFLILSRALFIICLTDRSLISEQTDALDGWLAVCLVVCLLARLLNFSILILDLCIVYSLSCLFLHSDTTTVCTIINGISQKDKKKTNVRTYR